MIDRTELIKAVSRYLFYANNSDVGIVEGKRIVTANYPMLSEADWIFIESLDIHLNAAQIERVVIEYLKA